MTDEEVLFCFDKVIDDMKNKFPSKTTIEIIHDRSYFNIIVDENHIIPEILRIPTSDLLNN